MANDAHPWRDIYSPQALEKLEILVGEASLPKAWATIRRLVLQYQACDKSDLGSIPQRRQLLAQIAAACAQIDGMVPAKADRPGAVPKIGEKGEKSKDAAVWIGSLHRRCEKKSRYLEELERFHAGTGSNLAASTPAKFLEFLNKKAAKDKSAEFLALNVSNRMEKMDPFHRGAEVHVNAGGISAIDGNPMSEALCSWLSGAGGTQMPFFMWLEKQPLCTATPGLDDNYSDLFKNRIRKVSYDCVVGAVSFINGTVSVTNLENPAALDTSSAFGKQAAEMAYVWAEDQQVYTAPHKPQQFHHSSFMGGKKVKCAGMWRVIKGKVHYIDDNSGHYRPQPIHLQNFARFLNQKGVFEADAKVMPHSMKSDPVAEYLKRDLKLESQPEKPLTVGAAFSKSTKEVPEAMKVSTVRPCVCGKYTWIGPKREKVCPKCGVKDPR